MRLGFLMAVSFVAAQESSLLLQNLQHVEQHTQRLTEDIQTLEQQKLIFTDHPWLPRSINKSIELKRENLELLKTIEIPSDRSLRSMTSFRSLVPGSIREEAHSGPPSKMFTFNWQPRRFKKKMDYDVRMFSDGFLYLASIGVSDAADALDENPPYLSLTLERARYFAQQKTEDLAVDDALQIALILQHLGEVMLEEAYGSPTKVSPSWLRYMQRSASEGPSKEEIKTQILQQVKLVSREEALQSDAQRRLAWYLLRHQLLEHYHHPHFRKLLMPTESSLEANALISIDRIEESQLASFPSLRDLSFLYGEPRLQGQTNACLAFAAAADWELLGAPQVSVSYLYTLGSLHRMFGEYPHLCKKQLEEIYSRKDAYLQTIVDAGLNPGSLAAAMQEGIPCEKDCAFNAQDWIVPKLNDVPARHHVATLISLTKRIRTVAEGVTLADIHSLIDAGITPMATLSFAARSIEEDWIRPEPLGSMGHALNIVGYGEGTDPFDLQHKDFIIVRDSLVPHAMHYRIAADQLLPIIDGLYKVTDAKLRHAEEFYPDTIDVQQALPNSVPTQPIEGY